MGCFLACFGFKNQKDKKKKKLKRPKPSNKYTSHSDNQSYVPLDSSNEENLTSDVSHLKDNPKEPSFVKIKKKVRFNLNVKAYEPLIPDINDDDDDDDEVGISLSEYGETKFDTDTKKSSGLYYEEDAIASSVITSYPVSYRYQNCRYSDDEEDEDLDELIEVSSDEEAEDGVSSNYSDDDDDDEDSVMQEETSCRADLKESRSSSGRCRYASSVLNPVENLSQWRVAKAKFTTTAQKENLQHGNYCSTNPTYSQYPTNSFKMGSTIAVSQARWRHDVLTSSHQHQE